MAFAWTKEAGVHIAIAGGLILTEKERTVTGMDEYIERRAAHDAVVDAIWHGKRSMYSVANAINSVPTADVAPVRHGRWICIRKGYGEYECSVCHGVDSDCSDYYGTHVVTEHDYCPNCGSRMDGYGGIA